MNSVPTVTVSNVTKSFGTRTVLNLPSLHCSAGALHLLTGHNGSGKSTFLRIIAQIEQPSTGRVSFAPDTRIGYCSPKPYMFRGTVLKNLTWGHGRFLQNYPSLVRDLCLEDILRTDAKNCSSGEIQKISLGRMLLRKPTLLLLDEPTANLDVHSRSIIEMQIRTFVSDGGTCIIATHSTDQLLRLSDTIIRLEKGKVTHGEINNIFEGEVSHDGAVTVLTTGEATRIICGEHEGSGKMRFCITSDEIVLSLHPLESSMRNSFHGTITELRQRSEAVEVTVNIGIPLVATITPQSLASLSLSLGSAVVVSFKASAVKLF